MQKKNEECAVTPHFSLRLFIYYMCLIVYLCIWLEINGFFGREWYFSHFRTNDILVIWWV